MCLKIMCVSSGKCDVTTTTMSITTSATRLLQVHTRCIPMGAIQAVTSRRMLGLLRRIELTHPSLARATVGSQSVG
jgi:hypothetical protein